MENVTPEEELAMVDAATRGPLVVSVWTNLSAESRGTRHIEVLDESSEAQALFGVQGDWDEEQAVANASLYAHFSPDRLREMLEVILRTRWKGVVFTF